MFHFKQSAFTLIELLVVMFIMAISLSIVIPITVGQVDAANERAEREMLVQFIQQQQALSLFTAQPIELAFSGRGLNASSALSKEPITFELLHIAFEEQQHWLSPYYTSSAELSAVIRQRNWTLHIDNEKAFWVNPD